MARVTLDEVSRLATQLSAGDKARLLAQVAVQVAESLEHRPVMADATLEKDASAPDDPWDELARIGARLSAMGRAPISSVDALSAMRR